MLEAEANLRKELQKAKDQSIWISKQNDELKLKFDTEIT